MTNGRSGTWCWPKECYLAGSLDGPDGAQLCGKAEEEETKHCWSKISPRRAKQRTKIFARRATLSTDRRGSKNLGRDMGIRAIQLSM